MFYDKIRLGKRAKIKQLFKKLDIDADFTFADLFSSSIARTVLLHYLDEIEKKRPPLLDFKAATEKGLLASMIINNPHLNPRTIMQLYGLKMALQHVSMRELRTMFGAHKARTWHRLMADASDFVYPGLQTRQTTTDRRNLNLPKTPNPFYVIRDCLMEFAALRKDLLCQKRPATTEGQMEVI